MSLDPKLYTRDWHLQDLALERLGLGDLLSAEERSARDHLAQCAACRARFEAIEAELAEPLPELVSGSSSVAPPSISPEPTGGEVVQLPLRRLRWVAGGVGAVVALAAGILVALLPAVDPSDDHGFQARGSELSFEVYRHDGDRAVRVFDADGVRAGDQLGFRVGSIGGGHLLVVGIDSALEPYPCYPPDPSLPAPVWAASPQPVVLDAAIELDATPGQERLIALLCDESIGLVELEPVLHAAAVRAAGWEDLRELAPGCLQREVRVHKLPEESR